MTAEQQIQEILSPQEFKVFRYLELGNKGIAEKIGIAESTVRALKTRINKKLGSDFVSTFTPLKGPGAELVLFSKKQLPEILK